MSGVGIGQPLGDDTLEQRFCVPLVCQLGEKGSTWTALSQTRHSRKSLLGNKETYRGELGRSAGE